ncbi:MAG: c-type cytochrome, partial [Acidobacteriota bacterium]
MRFLNTRVLAAQPMRLLLVAVCATVAGGVVLLYGQQRPAAPFTATQAEAGKAAYEANCASCHQPNLSGSGDASTLTGTLFMANWGARTTGQLYSFISTAMPPTN